MGKAKLEIIALPLDSKSSQGANSFDIYLISKVAFDGNKISESLRSQILKALPVLVKQKLRAHVMPFDQWLSAGKVLDIAKSVSCEIDYSGTESQSTLSENLLSLLGAEELKASKLDHDPTFDNLDGNDFLDVSSANDLIHSYVSRRYKKAIYPFIKSKSGLANVHDNQLSRWISSSIQQELLNVIDNNSPILVSEVDKLLESEYGVGSLQRIRDAVLKVTERLDAGSNDTISDDHKSALFNGQGNEVSPNDLNVLLSSALKEPLLARSTGLVTKWRVVLSRNIDVGREYVLQLGDEVFQVPSSNLSFAAIKPTVFIQTDHTYPVSYRDYIDSTNYRTSYIHLSGRYGATSILPENQLVKQVILQSKNSICDSSENFDPTSYGSYPSDKVLDDRPPEILQNERFGFPEPETGGLIFSAPTEDLITPTDLNLLPADREVKWPCYFHEDLWIGYRLDISREDGSSDFQSVHHQNQEIVISANNHVLVSGWTEGFYDREQPDDPHLKYTSCEIANYNGIATGQLDQYLKLVDPKYSISTVEDAVYKVTVCGAKSATPLEYGNEYRYRMRAVFVGGLGVDDTGLNGLSDHFQQTIPFYRTRSFRPGDLVSYDETSNNNDDSGIKTIYLTSEHKKQDLYLVPSPIDFDTARYLGLVLRNKDELKKHKSRKFIADIGKHFKNDRNETLDYFFDPDVNAVDVKVVELGGDFDNDHVETRQVNGHFCDIVRHQLVAETHLEYGKENSWERFRRIKIQLRSITSGKPRVLTSGSRRLGVYVPKGMQVEITISPVVKQSAILKTAANIASSKQYSKFQESLTIADESALIDVGMQCMTDLKIRVVNAVCAPREAPVVIYEPTQTKDPTGSSCDDRSVAIAERVADSEYADFVGRLELDAATTETVHLEAKWQDIEDNPNQPTYVLTDGASSSSPHSVVFIKHPIRPLDGALFSKMFPVGKSGNYTLKRLDKFTLPQSTIPIHNLFDYQCIENTVFVGKRYGLLTRENTEKEDASYRINFRNQSRKVATIRAVATSRFRKQYPLEHDDSCKAISEPLRFDAPSAMNLSSPVVSHVLPISSIQPDSKSDFTIHRRSYGIRVFIEPMCFRSGPGERIGIGCMPDRKVEDLVEVSKDYTQWGEDPVDRPKLKVTQRVPRAADFKTLDYDDSGTSLDECLYPQGIIGGRESVNYVDNIPLRSDVYLTKHVSLAAYALRKDPVQRLWYFDVVPDVSFYGFCGMALYRYQPHSLEGYHVSSKPTWVYTTFLYGVPVAWAERGSKVYINIGPVYDNNISYETVNYSFDDGISNCMESDSTKATAFRKYSVAGADYFELRVPRKGFNWTLFRKRFGHVVGVEELR